MTGDSHFSNPPFTFTPEVKVKGGDGLEVGILCYFNFISKIVSTKGQKSDWSVKRFF